MSKEISNYSEKDIKKLNEWIDYWKDLEMRTHARRARAHKCLKNILEKLHIK